MPELTPAQLLRQHGLSAKKSWGQCFLHDQRVVARIAAEATLAPGELVVELGAGLGILTRALAAAGARVIAVENDRELVPVLQAQLAGQPAAQVLQANALTLDLGALAGGGALKVVGNLPYNIASPLLFRLLDQRACVTSATLMLQRELAERLAAGPGSRTYGAPSVICQRLAEVRRCFLVGRGAFHPQPRVESMVIQLRPRPAAAGPAVAEGHFRQVVHHAFGHRRQTLRRSLGRAYGAAQAALALQQAQLDPGLRPEQLDLEQFEILARHLPPPSAGRGGAAPG